MKRKLYTRILKTEEDIMNGRSATKRFIPFFSPKK